MKNIYYLIVLIIVTLSSCPALGQSFDKGSTETEFVEYYKSKLGSLDPIEGIWIRKSSMYTYYEDTKETTAPSTSEVEIAIVNYLGKLSIYFIEDGICYAKNIQVCKITKSAVPNRYFFSMDWDSTTPPYCYSVPPQSFSVVNNAFSITYPQQCHTGSGTTISTVGSYYKVESTDNWNKIYPISEQ